jgi:phage protein D
MANTGERRGFDTLTPAFRILIDGTALAEEVRSDLIAVTVLEDMDATGMFSFSLYGWDEQRMEVKWMDDARFREGNAVEIEMGYKDRMQTLFKGEITGLEPEFPRDSHPLLTVRGHDRRHRLMRTRRTRTFVNMTDSDIAAQIAGDAGLSPETEDSSVTLDYVLQHNQTDLEFLQERARRIGYEVVVEDRTLLFRPRPNEESEVLTLNREVELLEFFPRLSTLGQAEEVEVRGWSPQEKREIVANAGAAEAGEGMGGDTLGPEVAAQAFGGTAQIGAVQPVQNQAEADQLARGRMRELGLGYIVGDGLCIGDPTLRAGRVVKIDGLGRRFSGRYYVTACEHGYRPDRGYRTAFSVRRNAS